MFGKTKRRLDEIETSLRIMRRTLLLREEDNSSNIIFDVYFRDNDTIRVNADYYETHPDWVEFRTGGEEGTTVSIIKSKEITAINTIYIYKGEQRNV